MGFAFSGLGDDGFEVVKFGAVALAVIGSGQVFLDNWIFPLPFIRLRQDTLQLAAERNDEATAP